MKDTAMWPRWLAAFLLGLPLTVAVVGLAALAWPGRAEITALPWMLLAFPVWIAAMALAFAVRSGARTWLWLGGASVLGFGLLYGLKALGWIGVQA